MRVTLDTSIPLRVESEWDGDAARAAILAWAGYSPDDDEDSRAAAISKAERLFALRRDESNTAGDLVAPCGSVADGEPYLSSAGLRYALAAVNGARGGIDAPPDVLDEARARIRRALETLEDAGEDLRAVKIAETPDGVLAVGYAVVWGGKDVYGEQFTPKTDLGEQLIGTTPPVLYEHAMHPQIGYAVLGRVRSMTRDEIGLLVEAELDRHSKYIALVKQLAERGALGMSTGAPAHLVERDGNTIKRWPIVEVSLTPTPAEPRTLGVEVYEAIRTLAGRETGLDAPEERADEPVDAQTGEAEQSDNSKEVEMNYVTDGAKSFNDFIKAVGLRQADALKAMGAGDGPSGGYMVPDALVDELLTVAQEESVFLRRAYVIRAGGVIRMPVIDVSQGGANTYAWYGGVKFAWQQEGAAIAETEPKLKQCTLRALALAGITRVSNRLIAQSRVDSELRSMLASALANYLDYYCIQGNGVGQPLGILNAPALVTVARDTASNFKPADAANMYARFYGRPRNAVWMVHPTVLPQLMLFATGNTPVWMPDMREGVAGTLLGLPVIVTENVKPLGQTGDVLLVDMQMYALQLARDIEIATSEHAYFEADQTAYRVLVYADGQPRVVDKGKYINTNIEASPFVALA